MAELQTVPEEVLWEEGMLLAPQHFQQAALRQQDLLHYHLQLSAPWQWGVVSLEHELIGSAFRVTRLEAVMPDGLAVYRHRDVDLEIDLAPLEAEARVDPVKVWLTVPARRLPGEPFAGSLPRHVRVDGPVVEDENTGDGAIAVRRLRPALELKAGPRPPGRYVSLPLAEIRVVGDGFTVTDYVPPRLRAGRDTGPGRWCGEMARRARIKADELAKRAPDTPDTHHAVRVLSCGLPPLEALVASGEAHPFSLYLALTGMAGWLAGAVPGTVPPAFPAYVHEEPLASFTPVREFVAAMLARVSGSHAAVAFDRLQGGFELAIRPDWAARGELLVGVLGQEGLTEDSAAEWMKHARIGSRSRVGSLSTRRIPGARRERVTDTAQLGMVPGKLEVLFRVQADPEFVSPGEKLVIYKPDDPEGRLRPRKAVLYTPYAK